ncbi:hypothetical protein [Spirosoma litoris]
MLTLQQVAAIMDERTGSGKPKRFRVTFMTGDRRRDTGGEVRTIEQATMPRPITRAHLLTDRRVNVQPYGLRKKVMIHLDLILWLNGEPIV